MRLSWRLLDLKGASSRVSLLIHLHARKITGCTVLAVADNVKNNETRGTVFLKYNEGDNFCNILIPNDTFLILVKIQLIKGTVHLEYVELEFLLKINVSDSNQLIMFLHQFGTGDHKSDLRTSRSLLVLRMYVKSICARAGLTIIYGMYSL